MPRSNAPTTFVVGASSFLMRGDNMNYTIGFSVGPASIGWSVLENDPSGSPQKIQDLGVRMFTPPEHPKTGISFATHRRESRIKRRYLRRRRYRKERIKALFVSVGLITQERLNCLFSHSDFEKDVYTLRAEGLDRKLTPEEWVRVLLHLSQRCGYFSSSTTDIESAEKTGIVKQTIAENQALLKEKSYRTVGEMFCLDPKFQITASDGRLWRSTRNHFDCYKINVTHEMMEDEVTALFQAQRSTGNPYASAAFQERYTDILFTRRSFDEGPGGDSPFRIRDSRGFCPFEKTKRRAFKSCYTFEFFSLLQGINKIRILSDQVPSRPLNSDEREIITALAHEKSNLTFWDLRNAIALPIESTFNVVPYRQSSIREAESKRLFRALQSYHMIREALGTIDITFFPSDTLDQVSEILNLYHRPERRMDALLQLGLSFEAAQALLPLTFYKVGNLSLEAMKKLIPYLEQGISYPVACSAVYGAQISPYKLQKFLTLNPELKNSGALDAFVHPTMLRALSQTTKVLNAIIREYGSPQRIVIQLKQELKLNRSEWMQARRKSQERQKKNAALMQEIESIKGALPTGQDLVKYKLYQEQGGICPYTGVQFDLARIFCDPEYAEVSHIIPYSVSFDDSYHNKVLACADVCRQKQNLLPLAYFTQSSVGVDTFIARVQESSLPYPKRRRLLKQNILSVDKTRYYEQNIIDSHYLSQAVCRLLENHLIFASPVSDLERPVQAINEMITEQIRRRLGLHHQGIGELRHAMEAVIIGSTTPEMLQRIAYHAKRQACYGTAVPEICTDLDTGEIISKAAFEEKYPAQFPEPWPGFCGELLARLSPEPERALRALNLLTYDNHGQVRPIFISQMPRRGVTGSAHQDTIRSGKMPGYAVSKTPLRSLKLDKSGEISNYYNPSDDRLLYEALKARLKLFHGSGEKAFAQPFYKPKRDGSPGPIVNKVKTYHKITTSVEVCGGIANHNDMIRVDIFFIPGEGYFFIPIYVADTVKKALPQKAFVRRQGLIKEMDDADFLFSLYPGDLIRIVSDHAITLDPVDTYADDHAVIASQDWMLYFVSAGVAAGMFSVISPDHKYEKRSLGIKTLLSIEKYDVDILGRYHKVHLPEKRRAFFPPGQ